MNELELLRALRSLPREQEPASDLWPAIAARIEGRPMRRAPRWPFALAASLVGLLAIGLVSRAPESPTPATDARSLATAPGPGLVPEAQALKATVDAAMAAPFGSAGEAQRAYAALSPDVRAALLELESAEAEIHGALAQDPRSRLLIDLLRRSQERRARLVRDTALG